ncbi:MULTISPECIES: MarR family winged helix-turn-helix transcriptional regulator [Paenibacillus]|uniref:MarR family winged helix-turn-helix transcriptional regulator n=1 Tax=Paenibacillus TaxID=44249 RepID=UPI0022B8FF50|nr:MarR family transcriptional regulator [Paenibacillus caseinilyticus]MCZ8521867.1 MarR family transcriptional regulator [Paenibacillus caseinilyticus]
MDKHPSEQLAIVFYRVNRTFQYLMSQHLKPYDITPEQWNVLKHLQEKDGLSQKDLSYMADKDKTTITRIINSLEQHGALRRQVNPNDRRAFQIFLTEHGRELIKRIQPIPDKVNRQASRLLSHEELVALKQMLYALQTQITQEINLLHVDDETE